MAYIGANPLTGRYAIIDDISSGFNGTSTAFGLTVGGQSITPELAQNCLIVINGSVQTASGGTDYGTDFDYGVAGAVINFVTAPTAGQSFYGMVYGSVLGIGQPSDGTVIPATITNDPTANFTFPADVTTSGDLNTQAIQATRVSGSTGGFFTELRAVSGTIGDLDITENLNVKNITLEEDVTVSGDLEVSGNIFTATGNLTVQNGTIVASSGFISGFAATGINTTAITVGGTASAGTVSAVSGIFTQEVSGATVVGDTVTGVNLVTSQSGVFTNISGNTLQVSDLTVTGKFTITGFPSITGFIGGDLHVSGIFANSGVISGTLSGNTVTGTTAQFTTGTFQTINIDNIDFTTVEAQTGIFSGLVSGAVGTFDVLNLPDNITGVTAEFTSVVSGAMISGTDANISDEITTSGIAAQFINTDHIQVERLRSQTFITGNPADDPVAVTGRLSDGTLQEFTLSGLVLYGPVTILRP